MVCSGFVLRCFCLFLFVLFLAIRFVCFDFVVFGMIFEALIADVTTCLDYFGFCFVRVSSCLSYCWCSVKPPSNNHQVDALPKVLSFRLILISFDFFLLELLFMLYESSQRKHQVDGLPPALSFVM